MNGCVFKRNLKSGTTGATRFLLAVTRTASGSTPSNQVTRRKAPRRPRCGPAVWTTRRRTGKLRSIAVSLAP